MAIGVLATLYAAYKMIPVQPSAHAAPAAQVAETKMERLNRAKAEALRAAVDSNECYAKYSDVDCVQSYFNALIKTFELDCAYADVARGNPELEKLHRRWRQDVTEQVNAAAIAGGSAPTFGGGNPSLYDNKCEAKL